MGSEWKSYVLGDLGSFRNGANYSKDDYGDYYPVASVKNLFRGRFVTTDGLDAIKQGVIRKIDDYLLKKGDLLFARSSVKREGSGQVAIVNEHPANCIFSGFTIRFRTTDVEKVDPLFLLYLFRSPRYREEFTRIATGTTIHNLSQANLAGIEVELPSIESQRKLAHILDSLDQKIELNRQINTTLESMAQALFKSWFVDFDPVIDNALAAGNKIPEPLQARAEKRTGLLQNAAAYPVLPDEIKQQFPDSFVFTEEMGWVPEGWEALPLSGVVSDIIDHRGKTPKKLGGDWSEDGYPAISAKNIKSGRLIRPDTIRFIDKELYRKWMRVPLVKGDVILTSEAPLGEMYFLAEDKEYVLSQRLFGIRADSDCINGCYLYFWLNSPLARSDLETRATGTTVIGIRQAELQKVLVLFPGKALSDEFSKLALDWMERSGQLEQQISSLANLRDSLLPKLLSGQLSIPEAEQALDQVI